METAEKECGALGGLFQAIVNDMKVTGGAGAGSPWEPAVSVRRGVCVSLAGLRLPCARVPGRLPGGVGARVSGCLCGPQGPCSGSPKAQRPQGFARGACAHPGSLRPRPSHYE